MTNAANEVFELMYVCTALLPCRYLLIMSDGIFEFVENEEVMSWAHQCAQQGKGPLETAKWLVRKVGGRAIFRVRARAGLVRTLGGGQRWAGTYW